MSREPTRKLAGAALPPGAKRNPSICACAWIALHPEISHAAARFLVILAQHVNNDGRAWPGLDTVGALGGMKRRSAQRAVAELLKHPQAPIARKLRRNTSPVYTLTLAAIEAPGRANQRRDPPSVGFAPGGVTDGAPDRASHDTPAAPTVARSLGDISGTLTLRNLGRTDNGNGASKEGRVACPEGTATVAVGAERRARPVIAPANTCDRCASPATGARDGAVFCDAHDPAVRRFWTRSGGRL